MSTDLAAGVSIHRYADFNPSTLSADKSIAAVAPEDAMQRRRVSVYGRHLTLRLEDHSALLGDVLRSINIKVQRGTIEGITDSWVRLTRVESGTHGLIWDGKELYAIEPTAEVRSMLDSSEVRPHSDTVIFKLSDTTVDLGDYCGTSDHSRAASTGAAAYQALAADFSHTVGDSGDAPTLRLEMQVLADAALRAEYDSDQDAIDALVVRLNNVDGIYSAQLGLAIQATNIQLLDPATALTSSTDPGALLSSLAQLRATTPGMNSYAATHLFTGRDLDGDILGISYIGNLCGARYAASLSELRDRGAWLDSLVAAHELGHQLGAVHDGTGACSNTPESGYLMSSIINGNDEFSSCSHDTIFATMQHAACLVPINTSIIGGGGSSAATNASSATPVQGGGGGSISLIWLLVLGALNGRRVWLHRHAA